MSLATDLLQQAEQLARHEPRRPKASSLRRAVSAAYYALFHLLVDESTRAMLGAAASRRGFRHCLARAFSHGSMGAACQSFAGGTLPQWMVGVLGAVQVPPDLRLVAAVFGQMQDERHRADYDLSSSFQRMAVLALVDAVREAFEAWQRVRTHETARFFLMALPLWDQLRRRGQN